MKALPESPYIFVDKDSPDRRFASGWDFVIACRGKVCFVEAKRDKGALSDFQKLTREEARRAGVRFCVLRLSLTPDKELACVLEFEDGAQNSLPVPGLYLHELTVQDFVGEFYQ